ncbi:MAG TPA: biotin/lipoyl-containing protein [Candidatus Baltobacteraceae bacterium]|nr:biotin/lipoyl-containing protein [Candidatus Baltobacteraceae bacterium]
MISFKQALVRAREAAAGCVAGNLAELRVEDGDFAVEVRRTPRPLPIPVPSETLESQVSVLRAPVLLRSENVGAVRLVDPIPSIGESIALGRELAWVECLGIRNPVKAGLAGNLIEILVEDGQAVDFGRPLFVLDAVE